MMIHETGFGSCEQKYLVNGSINMKTTRLAQLIPDDDP